MARMPDGSLFVLKVPLNTNKPTSLVSLLECDLATNKKNPGYKYLMDNQYLQEVSDEKDLGIMITSDLKSAVQVVEACKKANRALGFRNDQPYNRP